MENKIIKGDCLEVMKDIPDKYIDMILCDLPYGTTACSWDEIIPLDKLWEQYERVIKDKGIIILNAIQPFTSKLIISNIKLFKYALHWNKKSHSNPLLSKKQPLRIMEDICIFYKKFGVYNPQMIEGLPYKKDYGYKKHSTKSFGKTDLIDSDNKTGLRYPSNLIEIPTNKNNRKYNHPTQKPLALFEYLIKTYTNEGDLVLDNCAGSGTTGVACNNLNRNFILIEKEEKYIKIIEERLGQQSATGFTQNSTSSGFPTENSPNISLKTTPSASSKLPTATSLNNNIMWLRPNSRFCSQEVKTKWL